MTKTGEMLAALSDAVAQLEASISRAAGRWQEPLGEGEWAPRTVAEHIAIALGVYIEFIAGALGQDYFDWTQRGFAFTSAATAGDAMRDLSIWAGSVLEGLTEELLQTPVPEMEGSARLPATIEGVLTLATSHLQEHARQIAKE